MRNAISTISALKPYIFSALILTFCLVAAIDLGVFHFAAASQATKPLQGKETKPASPKGPIAFARYSQGSELLVSQELEESSRCRQSAVFQGARLEHCAPLPKLTSTQEAPDASRTTWRLPKSPSRIIWQQVVSNTQKLTVELIDSDGLPWPTRLETSRLGDKESVQIIPSYELSPEHEMLLVANLYNADGQRVENWVLPVSIENGTTTPLPWSAAPPKKAASSTKR